MQFRLDQLGKNLLRELFGLVGTVETEAEVPAGDAQRIDLWHVPDPALLQAHPEIEPGVLRTMAEEPGAVEVFSDAPGEPVFHEVVRKRYGWHHTLELRTGRTEPLPWVWMVCAGRPDGVLSTYGFELDTAVAPGVYVTKPAAWRIRIVAVGEVPRTRSTILLRLLGSARVRREAQRDLTALPADAWERRLAMPWLVRLSFEVPVETLAAEDKELMMNALEWYRINVEEPQRALEQERQARQAAEQERLQLTIQLFGLRLGRPPTEAERATLAARLRTLGSERVGEVALKLSADATAAWLADPEAR